MPLLRSVDEMRERLGFSADNDRDEAIEAHLETAVETISDQIRTEIDRNDVVDTFFVRFSLRSALGPAGRRPATGRGQGIASSSAATTTLLLGRGFVDDGTVVTVVAGPTEDSLDDSALRTDLRSAPGSGIDHVTVDYERGVLRVNDYGLDGVYVRVGYKAGFLDDDATPAVYQSIPSWLIRANDLETRILVNADAVFGRDQVDRDQQKTLETRLSRIVMKHARYIPIAEKPVTSVVTASAS